MPSFKLEGRQSSLRPGMAVTLRDGSAWLVSVADIMGHSEKVLIDLATATQYNVLSFAYSDTLECLAKGGRSKDICAIYKDHWLKLATWSRPKDPNDKTAD